MERCHRTIGEVNELPADLSVEELTRRANVFLEKNDFVQAYRYVCRLAEHEEADPQAAASTCCGVWRRPPGTGWLKKIGGSLLNGTTRQTSTTR